MEESPGEEEGVIKKKMLEVARFGEEKKKKREQITFKRGNCCPFLKKSCVLNL